MRQPRHIPHAAGHHRTADVADCTRCETYVCAGCRRRLAWGYYRILCEPCQHVRIAKDAWWGARADAYASGLDGAGVDADGSVIAALDAIDAIERANRLRSATHSIADITQTPPERNRV